MEMLAKGGSTLKKFFSSARGVLSAFNRIGKSANGKVKVLAAENESSQVLWLKKIYQSDTIVVSGRTSPDRNRTLTQRVVFSFVSALYDQIGVVAPYTVKSRLLL